jgi:dipeptidyl aminopeptidase/acylaminoacyl peptidase
MTRTNGSSGTPLRWLLAGLILCAAPASACPYQVDDMLATEGIGEVRIAPGGRWLVFERDVALTQVDRIDFNSMDIRRSRLFRVDLRHPGAGAPLLDPQDRAGTVMLEFSPRGTRLAVARLDGWHWRLGVVTLADGSVRWFDIAPDYEPGVSTMAWMSEDRLVTLAQPGDIAPWTARQASQDEADVVQAWRDFGQGRHATVTAIGSGPLLGDRPPPLADRLVALDVTTGRQKVLGTGDYESLAPAPDHRHVALNVLGALNHPPADKAIGEMFDPRRRILEIVDVETGNAWSPCPTCDVSFGSRAWSADGRRLLFFARPIGQAWEEGAPWIAATDGLPARKLALSGLRPRVDRALGMFDSVGLGWQGATPLLHAARTDASGRPDWFALADGTANNLTTRLRAPGSALLAGADGNPVLQDDAGAWSLAGDTPRALLSGVDGVFAQPEGGRGGTLAGWRRTADGLQVVLRGGSARTVRLLVRAGGDLQFQDASLAAGAAIVTATCDDGVEQLLVARRRTAPVVVATLNQHLAGVVPPRILAIRHRLPDGQAVTSWLYRPPASGKAPPLIVVPYAGQVYGDTPSALWNPGVGRPYTNVAALVGHGYAVLLPSMPALPPSDAHPFDFAGQVLSAVDAVIAAGCADPNRLGLWGHSFGGYTAATVATETDRFKAIVASNGIYDLASSQGGFMAAEQRHPGEELGILFWAGWTETAQPRLGGTASRKAAAYVANSPVYRVDRIRTPMMIVGADRDSRPISQAEELFSALYRQDKEARLVSYWGEDHVNFSPANVRDLYARVFAWFDDRFAKVPTPAPAAAP